MLKELTLQLIPLKTLIECENNSNHIVFLGVARFNKHCVACSIFM